MNETSIIPTSYEQWKDCITIRCGIPLTNSYIDGRLTEMRDSNHPKSIEFARLYGEGYMNQVIAWFEQARNEK